MAYLAVEPEVLADNRRFNPLDPAERDRFGQDFAQVKYSRLFDDGTLMTAAVYYNGANGWFKIRADPASPDQLLEFGIDQGFVGATVTASRRLGRLGTDFGLHLNDFSGDHTLDGGGERFYSNTGKKRTANGFAKFEYELERWLLFADLQVRWADFAYVGGVEIDPIDWTFFDPRIGFRRSLGPDLSLYGSLGRAQREPSRLDMLLGEDDATFPHDLGAVRPEEVVDLEFGVSLIRSDFRLQANLYAMEFSNEIALTGELSEVGLPLRRNVDDSYRRGLEFDLRWQLRPRWSLLATANMSRNRIREWTQFYDVYDAGGAWVGSKGVTYFDTPPLLSPEALLNLGGEWSRGGNAITLLGRWVDSSHLDNTGLEEFSTPAYLTVDLRATVDLGRLWESGSPRLRVFINNLLDSTRPYPSGYSYQFIERDAGGVDMLDGFSYYYPLATRNVMVALEFDL